MRKSILIPVMFLLAGCGSSVKNSWNNFRGYYNTFYNAKKSYKSGLNQVQNQPVTLDPDQIVRVHPQPAPAGASDFRKAIEKGARLLRKFPESKWTDDALLLIGKSYYYQEEFYPALQKFEELYELTQDGKMKELAALWKGRTLLDLQQHTEAINYLRGVLSALSFRDRPSVMAELMVIMGEHHAMMEEWRESSEKIGEALPLLNPGRLKGRTYFLYGQALERQERFGEAYFGYSNVESNHPQYEYVYWANVKLAEVARKEGNLDKAISIYRSVRNDDKNFERRNYLDLEIGRTYEMKEDYSTALTIYKQILSNDQPTADREIQSRTYFRLGQIYSDTFSRFELAAAYFDSSSQTGSAADLESAEKLAEAYGRYTELNNRSNRIDSLLWLGSLPAAELDSVLKAARQRRITARRAQQQGGEADRVLRNVGQNIGRQSSTEGSVSGFLNYRNPRRVTESKNEFRAVWGERPLADDWRRGEAVSGISSDQTVKNRTGMVTRDRPAGISGEEGSIDISDIPQTEEDRLRLRDEQADIQYEMGNLFFLTLNLPDSAATRFREVVEHFSGHRVALQSMYSLYEIYSSQQPDSAAYWANRILDQYPESVYAEKVSGIMDTGTGTFGFPDSTNVVKRRFLNIEADSSLPTESRALALKTLAKDNRNLGMAPHLFFRSIEEYIRLARRYTDSTAYNRFFTLSADSIQDDSASVDPTIYPFYNEYWDSARVAVTEFDTTFGETPYNNRITTLEQILFESKPSTPTCRQLGVRLQLADSAAYRSTGLASPVTFSILVGREGEIHSSTLVTVSAPDSARQAAVHFLSEAKFKPLQAEGLEIPRWVRCTYTFPAAREL